MRLITSIALLISIVFSSFIIHAQQNVIDEKKIDALNTEASEIVEKSSAKAMPLINKTLQASRKINYRKGEANALLLLASVEEDSGKYETALRHLNDANKLASETADSSLISRILINTGNIKLRQGVFEDAITIYMQSLVIADKIGDKKNQSDIFNNLGASYLELQKYDKAFEFHERALRIRKEEGWEKQVAASLQNIGNIYFAQEIDSLAMIYFQQSLEQRRRINDKSGMAFSLNGIAGVYVDYGEFDKAQELMLQAVELRKQVGELNALAILYGNLADVSGMEGNYTAALGYLEEGLKIAKATNAKRDLRNIYQSYSYLYDEMKDPVNSLKNYKLYVAYKDSVLNEKNNRYVNDLQAKYEVSERENKIMLQQAEIQQQKTRMLLIIISFILILIIGGLLYNRHRLNVKHAMQEEKIRQEKLRTQSIIMAQEKERKHIAGELHDGLGQVLSAARLNIESMTINNNTSADHRLTNALNLIDNSFTELRNISHRMMPVQLIRFGLGAAVLNVVDNLNKSEMIRFHFDTDDDFPRFEATIEINLFRIIQEWINNIVRFSKATEVSIQLHYSESEITLMMEDNGTGFDVKMLERGKGNGWHNINSRLNILGGQIEIDSKINKGTLMSVFIPLNVAVAV